MIKNFILFIFTIIFPLTTFGLDTSGTKSTIVKNHELPEASCTLVQKVDNPTTDKSLSAKDFMKNSGESRIDNSFCSATVIDKNKILTSAHCLTKEIIKEKENIQLICTGGVVRDLNLDSIHRKKEFDYTDTENVDTSNIESTTDDLATAETTIDIGITPAKIVESYTEFWELLDNHKCIAQGYGKDENGLTGLVNGIHIDSKDAWLFTKDQTDLFSNIFVDQDFNEVFNLNINSLFDESNRKDQGDFITLKKDKAVIMPGDSGGGFFCKNANNNWVLIGVNELGGHLKKTKTSFMINLTEHQDWLNKVIGKVSPFQKYHKTEKEQVEHFCRIYENCNSLLNENLAKLTADVTNALAKIDKEVLLEQSYQDLVTDLRVMIEKCLKKLNIVLKLGKKNNLSTETIIDFLNKTGLYNRRYRDYLDYDIDPVKVLHSRLKRVPKSHITDEIIYIVDKLEREINRLHYSSPSGNSRDKEVRYKLQRELFISFYKYYQRNLNR